MITFFYSEQPTFSTEWLQTRYYILIGAARVPGESEQVILNIKMGLKALKLFISQFDNLAAI